MHGMERVSPLTCGTLPDSSILWRSRRPKQPQRRRANSPARSDPGRRQVVIRIEANTLMFLDPATAATDKLTGRRVEQRRVQDMDPELAGRSRDSVVKILSDQVPQPPHQGGG